MALWMTIGSYDEIRLPIAELLKLGDSLGVDSHEETTVDFKSARGGVQY